MAAVHRAQVHFANGRLTVQADNSSLNQILREIAQQSGIKITGGVLDERVFGTYGPDLPAHVLAALLDGTGTNMLFLASRGGSTGELVLTPRLGGPTPPNPSADSLRGPDEATIDRPPDAPNAIQPAPQPQPAAPVQSSAAPGAAPTNADSSTPTAPPADSTTQQSPNGVKTPQQIYDQLIQLQKQQQQTTTPP